MIIQTINGEWEVRNVRNEFWLPATVPGTLLGTFIENEVTNDPYYRDNDKKILDLFKEDYEYKRTFEVDEALLAKANVDLVCFGLDTITRIYINDQKVAETANMHRTYRIPTKEYLKVGTNEIRIVFMSPVKYAKNYQPMPGKEIHYIPCNNIAGNQYLRKAHSQFGWDWGPQVADCGIWRDIQFEAYDARISRLSVGQDYKEDGIEVIAYVSAQGLPVDENGKISQGRYAFAVSLIGPDGFSVDAEQEITEDRPYVLRMLVKTPQLWWPNGYGAHPLYELTVHLVSKQKEMEGDDIERWISHRKIFSDTPREADEKVDSFAQALGISTSERHAVYSDTASNSSAGFSSDGFGVSESDGLLGSDDWFSDRPTIGGLATNGNYFAQYNKYSQPSSVSFDSDDGLFTIAVDESHGHSSDYLDDERFRSEIGMGPFDNMTIGGGLFDEDPFGSFSIGGQSGVASPVAAAPVRNPSAAMPAEDIRKYTRAQKTIIQDPTFGMQEKKYETTEGMKQLEALDEQKETRELTPAEQMLARMLVRRDESRVAANKMNNGAEENYVSYVEDRVRVANVSIDEGEEAEAEERRAYAAVAYHQTTEHGSAGQTVVSDTDTVMWIIDSQTKSIGLRSISVSQEKDEYGEEFALCVNGVKIFARGGNYIPQDAIYGWITPERIESLIKDCVRTNFNVIRVWGGGYYPSDYFYELCDRYGLIVWQDTMFACNVYDLDNGFAENVAKEIEDNARRIHHHACLGLWCGNNEIESAWSHWEGFNDHSLALRNDYLKLFEEIIPNILMQESPMTFYWSSSPSSFGNIQFPDDENHGDCHYWGLWHGQKTLDDFEKHYFRFCSEFGFQSYPEIKTLDSFTRADDRNLFSKIMDRHQKDVNGNNKLMFYISEMFLFPKDYESGVYLSQVAQGRAIKTCVEHMRRNRGRCMGALYWQINDCWPGITWAGIDYFGRWKALQYMAAKFFAPIAGSIAADGRVLSAYIENETQNAVRYSAVMNLKDMSFNVLDSISCEETIVDALSSAPLVTRDYSSLSSGRSGNLFIEAVFKDHSTNATFIEAIPLIPYKSLKLENPEIEVYVSEEADKFVFHLRAKKFAAYVQLYLKNIDAVFGDNFFHMTKLTHTIYLFKKNIITPNVTAEDLMEQLIIKTLYDSYSYD